MDLCILNSNKNFVSVRQHFKHSWERLIVPRQWQTLKSEFIAGVNIIIILRLQHNQRSWISHMSNIKTNALCRGNTQNNNSVCSEKAFHVKKAICNLCRKQCFRYWYLSNERGSKTKNPCQKGPILWLPLAFVFSVPRAIFYRTSKSIISFNNKSSLGSYEWPVVHFHCLEWMKIFVRPEAILPLPRPGSLD